MNLPVKAGEVTIQEEYCLKGFIVHRGETIYSGHHFACIRDIDNNWDEYNDFTVKQMSTQDLDNVNWEPYVLFHKKTIPEEYDAKRKHKTKKPRIMEEYELDMYELQIL